MLTGGYDKVLFVVPLTVRGMRSTCVSTENRVVEGPADDLRSFDVTKERADEGDRGDDNGKVRLNARVVMRIMTENRENQNLHAPDIYENIVI